MNPTDNAQLPLTASRKESPQQRAARIVRDVLAKRFGGGSVSEAQVLSLYPELHNELRAEFALAARIHHAKIMAERAGPPLGDLQVLTDSELEQPIEISSGSGQGGADEVLPRLPHFQIQQEISRGGQATVYRAIQESTGRQVAIKIMPGGPFVSSSHRARFDREAKLLASFDHPNIVGILERGRTPDGSFFFVMQYIDGLPLDRYWSEQIPRSEANSRAIVELFFKIAVAVEAAHERGVVHRDLKPSNIRVDKRGEPHILDFGLARTSGDQPDEKFKTITAPGQIVGSLPWASPEQVSVQNSELGPSSDVYSLGIVMYQALSGDFPYRLDGPIDQIVTRIRTAPVPAPSTQIGARPLRIDAALDAVVLKALAKSPAVRYRSAGALAQDLRAWLDGKVPEAARHRRRRRRARIRVAAVLALVCASVGWGTTRWVINSRTPPPVWPFPHMFDSCGITLVLLPKGTAAIGSPTSERGRDRSERYRQVMITSPFYIGTREVTQWQYERMMKENPSDQRWRRPELPVQNVSWNEATEFCRRLSLLEHRHYRLPTEEEWEYACHAADDGPFNGVSQPERMGWYAENSDGSVHVGGTKWANAWGVFDMHGNVAEWCSSFFDPRPSNADDETHSIQRVVKGGSALKPTSDCRAASRAGLDPEGRLPDIGFRVVCDP